MKRYKASNITRRRFLDRARQYAVGGLAAAAIVESRPDDAWAEQAPQGAKPQNWLSLTEEPALEPRLPIIDPHHHLWDRPGNRYLLDELVADTKAHNVRQTVFVECSSMYRAGGPARAFPDTTIIFNHLGGPIGIGPYAGRHQEVFAAWKPAIAELATCPNVVAKVGGIQMVVNGYGWHERKRPPSSDELLQANGNWYRHTIERFGPKRCMFESNFPVDRLSCSYTVLWNQFKKLTQGFSADERADMFHDTALRVYRLPRQN